MSSKTDFSQYLRKPSKKNDFSQYLRKEKEPSVLKEVAQQVPLAGAKGALSQYGNILETLRANPKESLTPSQKQRFEKEALGTPEELAFSISDDLAPEYSGRLPTTKDVESFYEMLGVPEAETSAGRIVGKGTEALTGAATLGPGGIGLAGLGGAGGESIREAGGPEWLAQAADVGINFSNLPKAALSKKFKPSSKQAEVTEYLRSKGLSDEKIVPIVQDKKKLNVLSKVAAKYEKKDPWLKAIKDDLGSIYTDIRERGTGAYLKDEPLKKFEDSFHDQLAKVPRRQRKLINSEVEDLFNNPIDFKELHDFKKAVNDIVKDTEGGKAVIGILKEPIEKAMASMNPSLYRELKLTDKAYEGMSNFSDKMTKKDWTFLISLGEAANAVYGFLTLNPAMMKGAAIGYSTKVTARQALTNPRLQHMNKKLWESFLRNDKKRTLRIASDMEQELSKED